MKIELKEETIKIIHEVLIKELNEQIQSILTGKEHREYDLTEVIWELETYSNGLLPKTIYK